ncbi:hypothetical protein BJV74DRAFT_181010 [Russula compacta]|nr:hypothetical protein BJV74DRAFT_181010 [Russula compacta]
MAASKAGNIIEDAAQKDSYIMKTHKRLSSRLGLSKTDSPPSSSLVKVNFQILQSPTDRREAPIVTCELGPDVKISELLWTFSRLPEDQRISLKQNPHFYFSRDLSDQALAYDDQFKLEPLKDLKPEKDSVVLVLLDRAGQIFVDYQKFSKTFGNIWKPDNAIILKDLQGTLEAANRISPGISGEVCIWQRGGGRPEEDVSKWTEVLDQALDLPDVDWLIRSETSPEEAFDIEVTGGWERCSPVTTLVPPSLLGQDDPTTIITSPPEDAHQLSDEARSPEAESSSVTVDSSSRESPYLSQDTPPSDVTVNISLEEAPIDVKECRSPVEDKDSLTADSSSETPQIEAAAHTPVPPANNSLGPFTPPLEIELTPEISASAPKRTAPVAVGSLGPQDEAIHAQTLLACSSEPLTLPIGTTVAPSNSKERTVVVNAPDDGHAQTRTVHPPALPLCLPIGPSTPPNTSELNLANSLFTPEKLTPVPESTRPQAEALHTPSHLGSSPSGCLTLPIGSDLDPASVVPTRNRTTATPSDGTVPRVEAVHPLNVPLEPPAPAGNAPTLNHATFHSNTTPRSEIDRPTVQSVRCPVRPIPPTGSKPTLTTVMPAPDGIPLFSEHARSPVEAVRRLPLVEPPVPPTEPAFPIGKMSAATESLSALHVSPHAERVRPQIEAVRSAVQNTRAPLKPRVPSIAVGSVPHLSAPPPPSERARQVEAPNPPVRPAYVPLDSRTPSVSNQSAPLNNVSVSDVEARISSRSRIKSHPRRMVAPIGPRRSTALQMNPQLTLQPSGQPTVRPGEHSGAHSAQVGVATSVSPAASNNALRMSSTIAQDPKGQSRRSTVLTGQMTPHLTSVSPTPRPVEKPVPGSVGNRSSSVPITRHYDRAAGALSHSSQAKSSRLTAIPEGQGAPKSYPMARSATPSKAPTAAATAEKASINIAISPQSLQNSIPRTSSIVDIKHSASQPRKSVALPDQMMSQQGVRSSCQPVMGLQSIITSPASNTSNFSDLIAKTHLGKTADVPSYNSRSDASGVAVKTETRGGPNSYSVAPRVLPTLPAGGTATISASPASNSTPRISSRIKTKDLINRHKQQNANVARSPSIAETTSLSRTPMSGLSQTAPSAGKLSANRTDSGIELWDYDPHGAIPDRRKGFDTANGHSNPPRDRGPSFTLPTNYPAGASNSNNEDGTSASLRLKKSRASIRGSSTPVVSLAHSDKPTRMSTPPPPEQAQTPLLRATRSSAGSPSSTTPGRREPFINRKPQPTSQSTSTVQSGFSTPPRSSTPSSFSRSASITTSSQTTIATPATSFTIPSRGPSPAIEPMHKSWFRRNVIDPVKSKLGYGS